MKLAVSTGVLALLLANILMEVFFLAEPLSYLSSFVVRLLIASLIGAIVPFVFYRLTRNGRSFFAFLIIAIIIAVPIFVIYDYRAAVHKEAGEVREPTLQDLSSHVDLEPYREKGYDFENWWFSGSLEIKDGRKFTFKLSFRIGATEWVIFTFRDMSLNPTVNVHISEEQAIALVVDGKNQETLINAENATRAKGNYVFAATLSPNLYYVSVQLAQKMSLNLTLTSRGLPHWYARGGKIEMKCISGSGIEDLFSINGTIKEEKGGSIAAVEGRGCLEHFWGRLQWGYKALHDWFPVNFDNAYALVFRIEDSLGNVIHDGTIYIFSTDDYMTIDQIEMEGSPREEYVKITASTSLGTLRLEGTVVGVHGPAHFILYFDGEFVYDDGRTIDLVNGDAWWEIGRFPNQSMLRYLLPISYFGSALAFAIIAMKNRRI